MATKKLLTAKQAFLFLSKEFEKSPKVYTDPWGYNCILWSFVTEKMWKKDEDISERQGICSGIEVLNYRKQISDSVAKHMTQIMQKAFPNKSSEDGFFWDTEEYDPDPTRAAVCFYLASKCK